MTPEEELEKELRELESSQFVTAEPLGGEAMFGEASGRFLVGPGEDKPKLIVSLEKKDNGYVLKLIEPPVFPESDPDELKPEEVDADRDKKVDTMIDGVVAFTKSLNDKAAGEAWKGEEDKAKIREGFKLLFGMSAGRGRPFKPMPKARVENMVFPGKEELLAYLAKNL